MRELTVGLVGLGYWGPNLLRVLADNDGVRVSHICDLDEDRLASIQRRAPGSRTTARFDDLLEDDSLDAIVIATPVYSHYELARRSLQAGKHTFVEKPLATTGQHAADLAASALDAGLTLMCGHTFLYSPSVRAVKQLIDDDELGEIYFVSSSRVNLGLHQRDISVLWDLAPHDFSILLYWLGRRPETVRAIGRDSIVPGISDVAFIDLAYADGALAHVELSWLAPSKLRRTVVVGSKRMVVYEDGAREPVRIFDSGVVYRDPETFGEYHLSYRTGDIVSPKLDNAEPLVLEMEAFRAQIRGADAGHDDIALACDVIGLIEATEISLRSGGVQVPFDAPSSKPGQARRPGASA